MLSEDKLIELRDAVETEIREATIDLAVSKARLAIIDRILEDVP